MIMDNSCASHKEEEEEDEDEVEEEDDEDREPAEAGDREPAEAVETKVKASGVVSLLVASTLAFLAFATPAALNSLAFTMEVLVTLLHFFM